MSEAVGCWDGGIWRDLAAGRINFVSPIAWMPLPEPPR